MHRWIYQRFVANQPFFKLQDKQEGGSMKGVILALECCSHFIKWMNFLHENWIVKSKINDQLEFILSLLEKAENKLIYINCKFILFPENFVNRWLKCNMKFILEI
jgi:hypothetical protein